MGGEGGSWHMLQWSNDDCLAAAHEWDGFCCYLLRPGL